MRSALLVATVALSAALIAAVSCAFASLNRALETQMSATVGAGDVRLKGTASGQSFDSGWLEKIRGWPETEFAVGSVQGSLPLTVTRQAWIDDDAKMDGPVFTRREREFTARTVCNGVDPELENRLRPISLVEGRWPSSDDEIAIDEATVRGLSPASLKERKSFIPGLPTDVLPEGLKTERKQHEVRDAGPSGDAGREDDIVDQAEADRRNSNITVKLGDTVFMPRLLRKPLPLKIVGIVARPPMGGRWQTYMTASGLAKLSDHIGKLTQIDVVLKAGRDAEAVVAKYKPGVPRGLLLQTTEKVTSNLRRNMQSNELGLILAATMAFLAAAFIITTGMTVGVTEKMRELGVLRCLGAGRGQLAGAQVLFGAMVGGVGGVFGTMLGIVMAFALITLFKKYVPTGPAISGLGLVLAPVGALLAGLIGAAVPAWQASRVTPLGALAARATHRGPAWIWGLLALGLACLAVQLVLLTLPSDGQVVFWSYATLGLPLMFTGYFLLGVPVVAAITAIAGSSVARLLGLPPALLVQNVRATPYRHGFTAGALMAGLGLMVAIWTQGSTVMKDWLGKLEFPDAFVTGLNLTPESQRTLESLPFVTDTCAITLQPVQPDETFGVRALQNYSTTFIAFEPAPFFKMTNLTWVQGDVESAKKKLDAGGAILVAREFHAALGLGVGDKFRCTFDGKPHEFTIAGVVTSPGLDIVSRFYNIGEEYTEQSLHAIFGSRRDLKERFGSEAIHMVQVGLKKPGEPGATNDEQAISTIKKELFSAGILDAGSGRRIKEAVTELITGGLLVASTIAIFSMLVACLGVANLIIAGIAARQFEFGVLRSIGGSGGAVARLVLGEAVIIALAACVLGTLMGFQGAFTGRRLDRLLLGIELVFRVPWKALAYGWGIVIAMALAASAPAVIALARKKPRELLGAMKG